MENLAPGSGARGAKTPAASNFQSRSNNKINRFFKSSLYKSLGKKSIPRGKRRILVRPRGAWRVARGAWRVARGAWRVARGAWRIARGAERRALSAGRGARGAWRVVHGAGRWARGAWCMARGEWPLRKIVNCNR